MSKLTDRIAGEHQLKWLPPEYVDRACECGLIFKMPMSLSASNVYAEHMAEVTEAAVREQVARDIEQWLVERNETIVVPGSTWHRGLIDGIQRATRIARGGAA